MWAAEARYWKDSGDELLLAKLEKERAEAEIQKLEVQAESTGVGKKKGKKGKK